MYAAVECMNFDIWEYCQSSYNVHSSFHENLKAKLYCHPLFDGKCSDTWAMYMGISYEDVSSGNHYRIMSFRNYSERVAIVKTTTPLTLCSIFCGENGHLINDSWKQSSKYLKIITKIGKKQFSQVILKQKLCDNSFVLDFLHFVGNYLNLVDNFQNSLIE